MSEFSPWAYQVDNKCVKPNNLVNLHFVFKYTNTIQKQVFKKSFSNNI